MEQRSGRIIRQGNRNKEVHIYRYVTESTFDAYLWQTVENKRKFISQIMTSKSPVRSCEDVDETAISYAEIKALCAGDERIKEKMDLDVDVARLKLMKASHQSQQYKLEDSLLKRFLEEIEKSKVFISGLEADMRTLAAHPHPEDDFAGIIFWVSEAEKSMIEEKMAQAGMTNLSAYLRRIAIDGMIVRLELPELKEMVSLLRYASNNINQIARRMNESGRVYDTDLEQVVQNQEQLWDMANGMLVKLAGIK